MRVTIALHYRARTSRSPPMPCSLSGRQAAAGELAALRTEVVLQASEAEAQRDQAPTAVVVVVADQPHAGHCEGPRGSVSAGALCQ